MGIGERYLCFAQTTVGDLGFATRFMNVASVVNVASSNFHLPIKLQTSNIKP